MCGFIVKIDCATPELTERPEITFNRILDDLSIRGPDEQNFHARRNVFLAHARLSIIDIKSGQQPMLAPEQDRAVVFNGEIYNYKDLKTKNFAYRFRTASDTELLLSLDDLDDPQDFLDSLRGMFSFCLVDFKNNRMLVARDRFGKKPLFCGNVGNQLIVSSRLKTIRTMLEPSAPPISAFGLGYYVDFGFIPAPFSMLQGIEKFLPGEWRVYDLEGSLRKRGYIESKTLPNSLDYSRAHQLTADLFEERMRHSIQTRLQSERPIGLLLSDGLDSSVIAKILADLRNQGQTQAIKAFILSSHDQFDESQGAAQFAKRIGLPYEIVELPAPRENVKRTLEILDEPFADLSIFPTFTAFSALKKHATVALTGDGGDELFGGYPFQYQNRFFVHLMRFSSHYGILRRMKVLKDLPHSFSKPAYLYRRLSTSGLFHSRFYAKYADAIPHPKQRFEALVAARPDFAIEGDIPRSQWHNAASLGLTDRMLAKVDACSMGAGVEARSPFLDEDLWNFVMHSNATQKDFAKGDCKTFLKAYLAPFKQLGAKRGFSMDYQRLLESDTLPEKSWSKRLLSDSTPATIADKIVSPWGVS